MDTLENARKRRGTSLGPVRRVAAAMALLLAGLAAASSWPSAVAAAPTLQRLAVLPFEIDDNSGEAGVPGRHDAMLASLTRATAAKIEADKLYDVVPAARVAQAVAAAKPGTYLRACNGCERDIARSVGADRVMIGWIFKMSTLVMSLHVMIKDVASGNVVYVKTFDFRGDNEKAWLRAADYMVAALSRAEVTN